MVLEGSGDPSKGCGGGERELGDGDELVHRVSRLNLAVRHRASDEDDRHIGRQRGHVSARSHGDTSKSRRLWNGMARAV